MRIIIGGDLVPTRSNESLFCSGDAVSLIGEQLISILKSADFTAFNLEVPLTDKYAPIEKCGPNLIASVSTVAGIQAINRHFFTLANNHIKDHGEQGIFSTCEVLTKYGIGYAGAAANAEQAKKPYVFEMNGRKIGFYCCAEHEYSIVTGDSAGANPFDALNSPDDISSLKNYCDFVIVLYHGGKEYYRYPSPYLQKVCRKMIDKGADIVICQHSHCVGCEEKYSNGTIVYGQGNFLFDHGNNEYWSTGLLVNVGDDFGVTYTPIVKKNETVRLADEKSSRNILHDFHTRSEEIKSDGFIEEKYKEFAAQMLDNYLVTLSGARDKFWFRALNKLSNRRYMKRFIKNNYTPSAIMAINNFIECEAHRELLLHGLKQTSGK